MCKIHTRAISPCKSLKMKEKKLYNILSYIIYVCRLIYYNYLNVYEDYFRNAKPEVVERSKEWYLKQVNLANTPISDPNQIKFPTKISGYTVNVFYENIQ